VIQLQDGDLAAIVDTSFGNNCRSLTLAGEEFVWTPREWSAPALAGIPLLAPWANRIDGLSYVANGRRYLLNPEIGNLRYDANHLPIHGLVAFTDRWEIVRQDASSVTSRLEFWRVPEWMAQFPFAHSIELTHRLSGGALHVETSIENFSNDPLPLCIGFHPYFQLPGSVRDQWRVRIAAREQVVLNDKLIPTGATRAVEMPDPFPLAGQSLDSVFTSLTGEDFVFEDGSRSLKIRYGSKYPVAIVYAPPGRNFVCFEPMTAPTNAFNLPNATLPHIAPGKTWREIFSIFPDASDSEQNS